MPQCHLLADKKCNWHIFSPMLNDKIVLMSEQNSQATGQGVVAVIELEGRYLMIRRALHLRAGGYWCFVGGAIEDGETQEQALVREVREEVGMKVKPGKKVWQCLSWGGEWLLHCWTVTLQSNEMQINPGEVAEVRWLTPQEIATCPKLLPSVIDFLKAKKLL